MAAAGDGGAPGAGDGGPAPPAGPPAAPPRRADLLRVVDRVQKKDALNIFRDPVTDEVVRGPPPRRARPARLRHDARRVRPTDRWCRAESVEVSQREEACKIERATRPASLARMLRRPAGDAWRQALGQPRQQRAQGSPGPWCGASPGPLAARAVRGPRRGGPRRDGAGMARLSPSHHVITLPYTLPCARQAPGYTAVIARPMDFTAIRGRLDAGGYGGWDALAGDMATMFANAMAFNRPDTVFHKQARARGRRAPALGAAGARKTPLRALPGARRARQARQQPCAWRDARTDKAVRGRDSGRV